MRTSKRLKIQVDNGQTIYKNRALTHDPNPLGQVAHPLPPATGPRRQTTMPVAISPKELRLQN